MHTREERGYSQAVVGFKKETKTGKSRRREENARYADTKGLRNATGLG
jgi:hypothetical protein